MSGLTRNIGGFHQFGVCLQVVLAGILRVWVCRRGPSSIEKGPLVRSCYPMSGATVVPLRPHLRGQQMVALLQTARTLQMFAFPPADLKSALSFLPGGNKGSKW